MQEESPEGGRFKKEVQIDNQSYLLLIRDEGGPPELQVSVHYCEFRKKNVIFKFLLVCGMGRCSYLCVQFRE